MVSDSGGVYPGPSGDVTWGPLVNDDQSKLAGEWMALEAAAAAVDGASSPGPVEAFAGRLEKAQNWGKNSIGGFSSQGQLIARGWIDTGRNLKNEYRIFLDGLVHPVYRGQGLGGMLLDWLTAQLTPLAAGTSPALGDAGGIDFTKKPRRS